MNKGHIKTNHLTRGNKKFSKKIVSGGKHVRRVKGKWDVIKKISLGNTDMKTEAREVHETLKTSIFYSNTGYARFKVWVSLIVLSTNV